MSDRGRREDESSSCLRSIPASFLAEISDVLIQHQVLRSELLRIPFHCCDPGEKSCRSGKERSQLERKEGGREEGERTFESLLEALDVAENEKSSQDWG